MKNTVLSMLLALPLLAAGQNDTLLFTDFKKDPPFVVFPSGNDTVWVNFDADGQKPAYNVPQNWYGEYGQFPFPNGAKNDVFSSVSFLVDTSAYNDNWLILPPIMVADDKACIHWKSAPIEGPAYMDGYFLLASTTDNFTESFTDTLFGAAECTGRPNFETADPAFFTFSPGYIHAKTFTDSQYFEYNGTTNLCKLEPHSYLLSDYAGKTIYLAFLHHSRDDNRLDLDDIFVQGTKCTTKAEELGDFDVAPILYPNPVDWKLDVVFSLKKAGACRFSVVDEMGREVFSEGKKPFPAGRGEWDFYPKGLAAGQYFLKIETEGGVVSRAFSKQ